MNYKEPFTRLLTQGMVVKETQHCPKDGFLFPEEVNAEGACRKCGGPVAVGRTEKMSKSKKNVVDPDTLVPNTGPIPSAFFACLPRRRRRIWSGAKWGWRERPGF